MLVVVVVEVELLVLVVEVVDVVIDVDELVVVDVDVLVEVLVDVLVEVDVEVDVLVLVEVLVLVDVLVEVEEVVISPQFKFTLNHASAVLLNLLTSKQWFPALRLLKPVAGQKSVVSPRASVPHKVLAAPGHCQSAISATRGS